MSHERVEQATGLMQDFAQRTGLAGDRAPDRYLWTDAYAVRNFLALWRLGGEARYLELAWRLVDQVHRVLGQHRSDDPRRGWLNGLPEAQASDHPTRGGLRIGKPRTERGPAEPADERLEWEQDGQYFHYLTQWMQALHQLAKDTGDARPDRWARELAATAHRAFVYRLGAGMAPRMYWKKSIDLSRPLVASMGHHDPLDGLITCWELRQAAGAAADAQLAQATTDYLAMCQGRDWATTDPLGLGGLLVDIARVLRLRPGGMAEADDLLSGLLSDAVHSLQHLAWRELRQPEPELRLGFRELGLSIGLHAIAAPSAGREEFASLRGADRHALRELGGYTGRAAEIERFWCQPRHRLATAWTAHRNINEVMLATSLLPADGPELAAPGGTGGDLRR